MTRLGFLSVPGFRHCHPCRASSFFRPFSVPPVVTAFTLRNALNWETVRSSFLISPGFGLGGLAFAVLACFPPGWNGGFHLWRYSGESLGRLLRPVDYTLFKCLGCRFAWSPWLLLYRAVASVTFGWRAATAAAPVLHTLRQPSFPRKNFGFVGVDGVFSSGFWAGVHLWDILSARYPSSASSPPTLVASWYGGSGGCLPFFPFSFSFGVFVTAGLMERELEGAFPSACSPFQLWGYPASALAVAGIGGRVLRAHPFFGTVD